MNLKAPMSRLRINDLRRTLAAAEMPERARTRYLMVLDEMESEWADEVMRRWHRRRNAPLVAAQEALLRPFADLLARLLRAMGGTG